MSTLAASVVLFRHGASQRTLTLLDKLLPRYSKRPSDWNYDNAIANGCIGLVDVLWRIDHTKFNDMFGLASARWALLCGHVDIAKLLKEREEEVKKKQVYYWDTDLADRCARNGHLNSVHYLRDCGTNCTYYGANLAASNDEFEVVRDLREHGIHCTTEGADWAAEDGCLEMIRELRAHDIHCSRHGADSAEKNGHMDVVADLEEHGIHTSNEEEIRRMLKWSRRDWKLVMPYRT